MELHNFSCLKSKQIGIFVEGITYLQFSFTVANLCFFFLPRLPDLLEYIEEPVLSGLRDHSSYVRRSAVMGCIKIYHLAPDFIEGEKCLSACLWTKVMGSIDVKTWFPFQTNIALLL